MVNQYQYARGVGKGHRRKRMTVRFSQNEIRFRVMPSELDEIIAGRTLDLASYPLQFQIASGKKRSVDKLSLRVDGLKLFLEISRDELELLRSRLPSRDGIEEVVQLESGLELNISFEVDVKAKRRDL